MYTAHPPPRQTLTTIGSNLGGCLVLAGLLFLPLRLVLYRQAEKTRDGECEANSSPIPRSNPPDRGVENSPSCPHVVQHRDSGRAAQQHLGTGRRGGAARHGRLARPLPDVVLRQHPRHRYPMFLACQTGTRSSVSTAVGCLQSTGRPGVDGMHCGKIRRYHGTSEIRDNVAPPGTAAFCLVGARR
jgi:hypothetical protein